MEILYFVVFYMGFVGSFGYDIPVIPKHRDASRHLGPVSLNGNPFSVENHGYIHIEKPYHHAHYHHHHDADLIRPCDFSDWACIRKYLAANSKCTPVIDVASDVLRLPQVVVVLLAFNITMTHTNVLVEGLKNAHVNEFYYRKTTGNIFISIHIQDLKMTAQKSDFSYHRKNKESIVLSDYNELSLPSTLFSASIPGAQSLRLSAAEFTSYVVDPHFSMYIGPKAYESRDPELMHTFATMQANQELMVIELLSQLALVITPVLIQQNFCDFAVKIP